MGKRIIRIPSMCAQIHIIPTDDPEKTHRLYGDHWRGQVATTYYRRVNHKLPFRVDIVTTTQAISVIAHEAVHAASYIFEAMGCTADFSNDEHVAYLVQHICNEAEELFNTYG